MDQQIWKWTLTKDAVTPCFVRDVLAMRENTDRNVDFFWLGHTPCRTVILVGMVVGIQSYEKRTIYTIDDGTAVIDCVLRHPHPTIPAPASRAPPKSGVPGKSNLQPPSPKKPCLDKTKFESTEPPPPITVPGYPVRVVGRVSRHYQSKQIHAETIDPCPSSLDEIAHLESVINLHKTKYSRSIPFVPPTAELTTPNATGVDADTSVFNTSHPNTVSYSLPPPPPRPVPVQCRDRPPSVPTHLRSTYDSHAHVPSSPTASSIASSTPSSPCKPSTPVKVNEAPQKTKLRHPSRLHSRDLTANTFRLYVKHYMDNAPPPFLVSCHSPSRSACDVFRTPTKHARDEDDYGEPTPRPRERNETRDSGGGGDEDGPTLGFTLSHLRRVPELALLAARVVRAEGRKRDKVGREKQRVDSRITSSNSTSTKANGTRKRNEFTTTSKTGGDALADPPRKKMKRLFSWAVVKLFEEGSIVLWDGDVRPLPVPPPPALEAGEDASGFWKGGGDHTRSSGPTHLCADMSASVLYTSSASASLYSHYHAPRRGSDDRDLDTDADLGYTSDPRIDEEAYVPLTAQLLARHVKEAVSALRRGHQGEVHGGRAGTGVNGRGTELTPEGILAYLQRSDGRWAKVGVWAVEEALALMKVDR